MINILIKEVLNFLVENQNQKSIFILVKNILVL